MFFMEICQYGAFLAYSGQGSFGSTLTGRLQWSDSARGVLQTPWDLVVEPVYADGQKLAGVLAGEGPRDRTSSTHLIFMCFSDAPVTFFPCMPCWPCGRVR